MGQVYEDLYQHLISEGIDDSVATSVVNDMYDKEQYHNVEQLDEAAFKAASMIGRVAAKMMGFGKVSARAARGAGAQTLRTLNRRGSEAFQRGIRRRNWTPDRALPSGTSAGVRQRTLASLTKGSTASKSGGLVTTGRGGTLAASSGGGKLGPVPKIEKVKVRDLGPSPSSGGPTRYQGTTSGGQLPQGGGTSSKMGQALEKLKLAATGGTSSGPATPAKGGSTPKALPGAGQTASRRNTAAATAAAAAAGTTGTGVKTGTTSAIKLRQGLSDRVRRAKDALRNANLSKAKLPLAVGAGTAAGFAAGAALTGGGSNISDMSPGGDTPPTTPKDNTLADKKPPTPKLPDYKVDMKFKGNVFTDKPKTDEPKTEKPKTKDDATANVKAAYEKGKPFDIRDRDITARASYDPRLKSERERMKRIKAERKARREKK